MTVIRYSIGKLLGIAFFSGAMAAFWLWMLLDPKTFMNFHGRYSFLVHLIAENAWLSGGLFAVFFGATAVILMTVFGDRTALALGPEGIEARTLLGRHEAGWARVAGIAVEKAGPLGKGGETLNVRLRRDIGEKIVRLSLGLLEQSRWEIARLLEATGRPGVRGESASAPVDGPAEPAPAMDYDAVIARHLAARENNPPLAPAAPAFERPAAFQPGPGGFGRKGL